MMTYQRIAAIFLSLLFSSQVYAQTRLDDSASPVQRVNATAEWVGTDSDEDDRGEANASAMIVRVPGVEYRLNTSAQRGRNAKIYLVLPATITGLRNPSAIRAEWRTRSNTFLSGSVSGGNRTLVFSGRINDNLTTQIFDYTIHIDASTASSNIEFRPHFEIEVTP
jgi:hypothetical protein